MVWLKEIPHLHTLSTKDVWRERKGRDRGEQIGRERERRTRQVWEGKTSVRVKRRGADSAVSTWVLFLGTYFSPRNLAVDWFGPTNFLVDYQMRFKTIIRYKNPKQPELGKIRNREDDLEIQKGRWRMKREKLCTRVIKGESGSSGSGAESGMWLTPLKNLSENSFFFVWNG